MSLKKLYLWIDYNLLIDDIFGSIFYWYSIVGVDIYSICTKMGGGIHRTIPLRMRTHAYTIM